MKVKVKVKVKLKAKIWVSVLTCPALLHLMKTATTTLRCTSMSSRISWCNIIMVVTMTTTTMMIMMNMTGVTMIINLQR